MSLQRTTNLFPMTLTSRESYFSATQIVVEVLVETHFQVFLTSHQKWVTPEMYVAAYQGGDSARQSFIFFSQIQSKWKLKFIKFARVVEV